MKNKQLYHFWVKWMLASVFGWSLGCNSIYYAFLAIWIMVMPAPEIRPGNLTWAVFFAAIVAVISGTGGLLVGSTQWVVLRQHTPGIGRWILPSIAGWALGPALFTGVSWGIENDIHSTAINQLALIASVAISLSSVAVGQWLVLSRKFRQAAWWIPVSIVGTGLAVGTAYALSGWALNLDNLCLGLVLLGVAAGAIYGLVTGWVLWTCLAGDAIHKAAGTNGRCIMENQMEESPVVRVDFPEAEQLADLASIFQDLEFAVQAGERLLDVIDREHPDSVLVQSLWTAALISYVRCFATGKRFGLSEETISHLDGEPIEVHRFYRNLRDKHIAHSVSPFDEFAVGLILPDQESGKQKIQGVATLFKRHIAVSRQGIEQFTVLASALREEVRGLAKEAETRVLEVGRQIPLSELYGKPRLRVSAPSPEEAGLARD